MSTEIQWTDETWNPVRGCSRVSSGCDRCYAMGQAHRFAGPGKPYEGLTTIRRGKVDWAGHAKLIPEMLAQPLKWKKPRRIFVNSMSDLFHESLSFEEIAAVFGVMAACRQHTFQVLTKRPKRALEFFAWLLSHPEGIGPVLQVSAGPYWPDRDGGWFEMDALLEQVGEIYADDDPEDPTWPLPNVWLGVSTEDQKTADERIPLLLQCPAVVRFVSAEPLLGEVAFEGSDGSFLNPECWGDCACGSLYGYDSGCRRNGGDCQLTRKIDWVIVGGESGPGARPCNVEWIRSIVRQCKEAKVPCFVKQLGARPFEGSIQDTHPRCFRDAAAVVRFGVRHKKGAEPSEWASDLRVREFPEVAP